MNKQCVYSTLLIKRPCKSFRFTHAFRGTRWLAFGLKSETKPGCESTRETDARI